MNKQYSAAVVAVMVMILLANPVLLAAGNPIPGRWEKVTQTKPGEKIRVLMKSGITHHCRYQSVDDEILICSSKNQDTLKLDLVAIDKVTLDAKGKHIKKGLLYGILGGVLAGGCLLTQGDTDYAYQVLSTGAALGGVAGMLLFAAKESDETIYISKEAVMREAAK